ncbi:UDP-3-O-(3-hydroxymyristoyl)glucosamine N-acyltransferase [Sangeribacter muris]|mgnify:FL=1|jgi:UDP-3-O-[3-hydroxymyristoyl] glucosamine N-acyltransferase|uniref:UDP-3-O-(3-hydroxymyristoyl)glucosamine N-acyltransferase n=1 Tax=Sangeribacter muris TaxID=2880703 RepID=UPI000FFEF48A|nr:UDP-3-O-(3-hydroxymyristoyl)glucosamine N-acyltransferase [Sangeribacter muris]MBJ2192295.1 UDP-3-O-(3-hydroxymyristoyl)glucosamine N-acyltransferase [Muribaculaceae bacterium]RXE69492.1 UDP-3-O-(3-hydroxymyristoyl)glucosamine N-acyltransferase [Muribaculaceae bacterium Isolate-001 (NCI)]
MELTPQLIASLIDGKVEGDGNVRLTGFAKIEEAAPGYVTFIANPKYSHYIYETEASAVLVSDDFVTERPVSPVLIRVKDPYVALADLMNAMESTRPRPQGIEQPCFIAEGVVVPDDAYIGAFAYIGKGVHLGKGVKVYPQSYIGENVTIGDGSVIRAGVRIYQDCVIGKGCIIHSGAVIGADGFGFAPRPDGTYEKIPQIGNVVIDDDVEIGANTTVDRATFGSTRIGKGTKLDNLIQVAHNVEIGTGNVFAAQVGVAGSTKIGDFNQVGGQVGFAGHIHVGNMNQFGAQSGIPNNVGDGNRLIGYPAVGLRQFAKTQVYLKRLGELFENTK